MSEWLRSLVLPTDHARAEMTRLGLPGRELMFFDLDETGAAAVPPAATGSETPPAETEPPPPAEETPPPADPAQPEPDADDGEDEDDDTDVELTPDELRSETDKARRQAARYRTQRNTARTELATATTDLASAQARIAELEAAAPTPADPTEHANARAQAAERRTQIAEAVADAGIPHGVIKAARALDAATDDAGIAAAIEQLRPFLAPRSAGVQAPPIEPGNVATLTDQIADAEKRGDTKTSMRLKSQQLAAVKLS